MSTRSPRLNVGVFKADDVVIHYKTDRVLVVVERRWRSECLNLFDPATKETLILHPRWLDRCTQEMVILSALAEL